MPCYIYDCWHHCSKISLKRAKSESSFNNLHLLSAFCRCLLACLISSVYHETCARTTTVRVLTGARMSSKAFWVLLYDKTSSLRSFGGFLHSSDLARSPSRESTLANFIFLIERDLVEKEGLIGWRWHSTGAW